MFLLLIHQMADGIPRRYSLVKYWRYVFVPLVIVLIMLAWYVIFSLSPVQTSIGALPPLPMPTAPPAAAVAAAAVAKT